MRPRSSPAPDRLSTWLPVSFFAPGRRSERCCSRRRRRSASGATSARYRPRSRCRERSARASHGVASWYAGMLKFCTSATLLSTVWTGSNRYASPTVVSAEPCRHRWCSCTRASFRTSTSPSRRRSSTSGTSDNTDSAPRGTNGGNTSEPGLLVAGDGAGILGAEAAMDSGRVAALEAAHRLGMIDSRRRDALAPAAPHRPRSAPPLPRVSGRRFRAGCGGALSVRPDRDALPLRRGDGGRDRPCHRPRLPRSQPGQGVHTLRDGALPGSVVRNSGERDLRKAPANERRRGRTLPHPSSDQTPNRRRARRARKIGLSTRRAR